MGQKKEIQIIHRGILELAVLHGDSNRSMKYNIYIVSNSEIEDAGSIH